MDMIIGCIFLGVILIILLIFCKNITFNVNIVYPTPEYTDYADLYSKEGEPKDDELKETIDDALKSINSIMLDQEEDAYE